MSNHPVSFFEIVSDDAPRLMTFYSALFGWRIDPENGMVDTKGEGEGIAGVIGPRVGPNDRGCKIYVKTDALEDTIARAQALGSTIYLHPMTLPDDHGRIAVVSDPDGSPVGLWAC